MGYASVLLGAVASFSSVSFARNIHLILREYVTKVLAFLVRRRPKLM